MNDKVQSIMALKPCPFCGNETPEFERMGTPRQSCVVRCGNCGALHESGDEGEFSGTSWNERAAIREAIAAPGVAQGWQPIESAPKIGRGMILLLTPSGFPQVAFSNTWWTSGFSVECKPTRWMPIPSPTAEQPVTIKGGRE